MKRLQIVELIAEIIFKKIGGFFLPPQENEFSVPYLHSCVAVKYSVKYTVHFKVMIEYDIN